jgi:hypothetical protein
VLVGQARAAGTADGTASTAGTSTSPAASATNVVTATPSAPTHGAHSTQVQVIRDYHPSFGTKLGAQGIAVAYIDLTE